MKFIYNLGIHIYGLLIRLASIFDLKARQWVTGRKELFRQLENAFRDRDPAGKPLIWFHASSLGEFEQGRPIIEAFRKRYPRYRILVSFFSPSGFEVRKNYDQADYVFYLPLDTPARAKRWIEIIRPAMAVFIKYDFWFNMLNELHRERIPVYFISALFRPRQHFFQFYGGWFREQLGAVTWFFTQNEQSRALLESIGLKNASVTGDTRFDRVYAIAKQRQSFPLIERFCGQNRVFIGGSIWKEDDNLIIPLTEDPGIVMKYILAPHNTSPERIQSLKERLKKPAITYSELTDQNASDFDLLIIDSVGILAHLYQYAAMAFIGGGFGVSIHNIQEPITFGIPVLFGPRYHKFKEATDLVSLGGAFCVHDATELSQQVRKLLADPVYHQNIAALCIGYVNENRGATEKIMRYFETVIRDAQ